MIHTTRTSRFWMVGLGIIGVNMAYLFVSLLVLREKPSVPEWGFHVVILLVGLALLDWRVASDLLKRLTGLALGLRGKQDPNATGNLPKVDP